MKQCATPALQFAQRNSCTLRNRSRSTGITGHDRRNTQHTLGRQNGNWRRIKRGLPQRYRLFFMFASTPLQVIIYAWLNDEDTLRKEGSRTDVYEVFKRMLERGEVPSTIDELIQGST